MALTLGALAEQIGGRLEQGNPGCEVGGVATLQHASTGDISFLANRTYRKFLASTRASAVILAAEHLPDCPVADAPAVHLEDALWAFIAEQTGQVFIAQPAARCEGISEMIGRVVGTVAA